MESKSNVVSFSGDLFSVGCKSNDADLEFFRFDDSGVPPVLGVDFEDELGADFVFCMLVAAFGVVTLFDLHGD